MDETKVLKSLDALAKLADRIESSGSTTLIPTARQEWAATMTYQIGVLRTELGLKAPEPASSTGTP